MVVVFGVMAALGVGFFWLRGGWTLPLLLTLAYCGFGGLLALEDAPGSFAVVLLLIWAPCLVWRMAQRPRTLKVIEGEYVAIRD